MKKLILLGLAVALLVGATFVPPRASAAQGAGLVSSLFNKMERNRRDLKSLKASVIIQKIDPRFGEEFSRGSVQYVAGVGRDANVRLDINSPRQEILAVKEGKYTLFKPKMNMAYQGRSNKAPKGGGVLSFVFTASGAQLKNNYIPEVMGEGTLEAGGPHVTMIKLTPKGGADFKFAEIWVDDSGMPIQTRVTERNGDSTLVRLGNIQKNAPIPAKAFEISLPSDVKIVKS